jgi:hypothetical protein
MKFDWKTLAEIGIYTAVGFFTMNTFEVAQKKIASAEPLTRTEQACLDFLQCVMKDNKIEQLRRLKTEENREIQQFLAKMLQFQQRERALLREVNPEWKNHKFIEEWEKNCKIEIVP